VVPFKSKLCKKVFDVGCYLFMKGIVEVVRSVGIKVYSHIKKINYIHCKSVF